MYFFKYTEKRASILVVAVWKELTKHKPLNPVGRLSRLVNHMLESINIYFYCHGSRLKLEVTRFE